MPFTMGITAAEAGPIFNSATMLTLVSDRLDDVNGGLWRLELRKIPSGVRGD
jgi:hypothetical protein